MRRSAERDELSRIRNILDDLLKNAKGGPAVHTASDTGQTTEGAQAERRLSHDERLARVLAFVTSNADLSERKVAKETGVPASTFRQWQEYRALRALLAGKVPSGYKTRDGTVEAYD